MLFSFFLTKDGANFWLFYAYNYIKINQRACLWIDTRHTQYKERRRLLAHAETDWPTSCSSNEKVQVSCFPAWLAPVPGGSASGKTRRKEKDAIHRESAFHFTRPILQKRDQLFLDDRNTVDFWRFREPPFHSLFIFRNESFQPNTWLSNVTRIKVYNFWR